MSTKLLVVEHEEHAPAGWLGEWWAELGCELDVRRPYAGEALPRTLDGHDGLVVLGGSMDSWDDTGHPWLAQTRELFRIAETSARPALGICLGHQLAARAFGGTVGRNPAGATIAVRPVGWTEAASADPLLGRVPAAHGVHWNDDVVLTLPDRATVLARTPDGAVQAARFGDHVWGVQLHPEAGPDIVRQWVALDRDAAIERGVDVDGYLADVEAHADELARGWRPLAVALAELARSAAARRGVA